MPAAPASALRAGDPCAWVFLTSKVSDSELPPSDMNGRWTNRFIETLSDVCALGTRIDLMCALKTAHIDASTIFCSPLRLGLSGCEGCMEWCSDRQIAGYSERRAVCMFRVA